MRKTLISHQKAVFYEPVHEMQEAFPGHFQIPQNNKVGISGRSL